MIDHDGLVEAELLYALGHPIYCLIVAAGVFGVGPDLVYAHVFYFHYAILFWFFLIVFQMVYLLPGLKMVILRLDDKYDIRYYTHMDQIKLMLALYGTDMAEFDLLCDQADGNLKRVFYYMWKNDLISDACADYLKDAGHWT